MSNSKYSTNMEQTKQVSPLLSKCGNFTVVTSSMYLLFSFLLRQLKFLSTRNPERFGEVVGWATTNLTNVVKKRDNLRQLLEEVVSKPLTGASKVFGCEMTTNENGKSYCYSHWYNDKNFVPKKVQDENTLVLADARCNHLAHQICFRLSYLLKQLGRESCCEFDVSVEDKIQQLYDFFDVLKTEAQEYLQSFKEVKKSSQDVLDETLEEPVPTPVQKKKFYSQKDRTFVKSQRNLPTKQSVENDVVQSSKEEKSVPKELYIPKTQLVRESKFSYASITAQENTVAPLSENVVTESVVETPVEDPLEQPKMKPLEKTVQPSMQTRQTRGKNNKVKSKPEPRATQKPCVLSELQDLPEDLVQVKMHVVVDDKPAFTTVLISKSKLAEIPNIDK